MPIGGQYTRIAIHSGFRCDLLESDQAEPVKSHPLRTPLRMNGHGVAYNRFRSPSGQTMQFGRDVAHLPDQLLAGGAQFADQMFRLLQRFRRPWQGEAWAKTMPSVSGTPYGAFFSSFSRSLICIDRLSTRPSRPIRNAVGRPLMPYCRARGPFI